MSENVAPLFPVLSTVPLRTIVDHVRRIVEQHPDTVYEPPDDKGGCVYVETEAPTPRPSCLLAQALFAAQVPIEELIRMDSFSPSGQSVCIDTVLIRVHDLPEDVMRNPGRELPEELPYLEWLMAVQAEQDSGTEWALCLSNADRDHPLPLESR